MAYESYQEDLLDDIQSFVSDNIATYVTGINTAKDDGLSLDAFVTIEAAEPDPYALKRYPAIQIDAEDIVIGNLSIGTDEMLANIVAVIAFTARDGRRTRAHRYAEALRQLLRDQQKGVYGDPGFDVNPDQPVVIRYYATREDNGVAVVEVRFQVVNDVPR